MTYYKQKESQLFEIFDRDWITKNNDALVASIIKCVNEIKMLDECMTKLIVE